MESSQTHTLIDVLYADQSELARDKLARIEAILLEDPQTVGIITRPAGIIARLLAQKPKLDFVDSSITDANSPTDVVPKLDDARLERYDKDMSSKDILAALAKNRRRAAKVAEVLAYYCAHRDELRGLEIVGLGQEWVDVFDSRAYVVELFELKGSYYAIIVSIASVWSAGFSFLSLPLEEGEVA